ncbi:MAG TPA: 1-(5-phosphoribosyl)-5-[(5-phosphoribosylamino)methylideneamino] imidazole-4-carboxamide isomerase [Longimicrobiales bacterium]|nr:1-(5-phosphoribosyl)-5-[(5-phosphoribosylamino)methylideneamino] imidazole-4-carboxamide isomerase [Longimicrobiales bacterium]
MIVYAAIDLRGGRVVQLVGGQPDDERVSLPDAAAVAREWVAAGFSALHVVDLDAALGLGSNASDVDAVIAASRSAHVQVGGGVRTTERVRELLETGAATVVVGTRGVTDRAWLEEIATRWPDRVVLAADVSGDEVVVHGWKAAAGVTIEALLGGIANLPLAGVLVTDVAREGRMSGADTERFRQLAETSPHPVLASGGIAGPADLEALSQAGVAGAVVGMALYTGALDTTAVTRQYV